MSEIIKINLGILTVLALFFCGAYFLIDQRIKDDNSSLARVTTTYVEDDKGNVIDFSLIKLYRKTNKGLRQIFSLEGKTMSEYWEELDKELYHTEDLLFETHAGIVFIGCIENGEIMCEYSYLEREDIRRVFDFTKLIDRREEEIKSKERKKIIREAFQSMSEKEIQEILDKIQADHLASGEARKCACCLEDFNQYAEGSMESTEYFCSKECCYGDKL